MFYRIMLGLALASLVADLMLIGMYVIESIKTKRFLNELNRQMVEEEVEEEE